VMQEVRREQVEQAECSGRVSYLSRAQLRARLEAAKTASLSEKARQKLRSGKQLARRRDACRRSPMFKKKPPQASRLPQEQQQTRQSRSCKQSPGLRRQPGFNNNNSGMLSDAGIFAYCSLTATALAQLYPEDWHKEFREKFLADVLHTSGRIRFRNSATAILRHGQADCSMLPFAEALLTEESVRACPEMVLQDLLLVALREGCYDAKGSLPAEARGLRHADQLGLAGEWELKTAALLNDPASEAEVVDEAMKRNRRRNGGTAPSLIGCAAPSRRGLLIRPDGRTGCPAGGGRRRVIIGRGGRRCPSAPRQARPSSRSVFAVRVAAPGLTGWKMRKRWVAWRSSSLSSLTPAAYSASCTCASQCRGLD
uniref:HA2 domain-containing protein n=1 Tax=Macrostomum lignano TaxID=282301 RepID=A0A1I8F925_9PLAT